MQRIIFFNVGWMEEYRGHVKGDSIRGGGTYVQQHQSGHEIFNFLSYQGRVYGYVRTQGGGPLKLERVDEKVEGDTLQDVLVVWTARNPNSGGTYIVGWYEGATLHRHGLPNPDSERTDSSGRFEYFAEADQTSAVLLTRDARVLRIPRASKDTAGKGQSNVWYADRLQDVPIRNDVLEFIASYRSGMSVAPVVRRQRGGGVARQVDPILRAEVEVAAVRAVWLHFEKRGYELKSVEADNVGWDLEAVLDERQLRVEVKGRRDDAPIVELTPNEYSVLKNHRADYRLCVVTNALESATLRVRVIRWSDEQGNHVDEDGTIAAIREIVAARITL